MENMLYTQLPDVLVEPNFSGEMLMKATVYLQASKSRVDVLPVIADGDKTRKITYKKEHWTLLTTFFGVCVLRGVAFSPLTTVEPT